MCLNKCDHQSLYDVVVVMGIIIFVFCQCACVLAKFIGTARWAKNISVDPHFKILKNDRSPN